MSSAPIGIFDSGIGGLTVASAISKLLPGEKLVYFGDTAHLPYGDKSAEAIKYYSLKIGKFLLDKKCKMIVIACNSASSQAFTDLVDFLGDEVPIINVIDPVVDYIAGHENLKSIGIIGTKATIKTDVYARKIHDLAPERKVSSLATPLLAPMIEEGFFNNNISKTVINSYLSSPKLRKIDSLVLACTHYPLIKAEISDFYHGKTEILNTAEIVAEYVKAKLTELGISADHQKPRHEFYVSDYTTSFEKSTKLFFNQKIHLRHFPIWD